MAFAASIAHNGSGEQLGLLALASSFLLLALIPALGRLTSKEWIAGSAVAAPSLFTLYAVYLLAIIPFSHWHIASYWLTLTFLALPFTFFATATLGRSLLLRVFFLLSITAIFAAGWQLMEVYVEGGRPNGPFRDSNAFAALVNAFFFPTLYLLLATGTDKGYRPRRLLLTALLGLYAAALFATSSRAGLAAWLVLFLAATVLACRLYGVLAVKRLTPAILISVVAFAFTYAASGLTTNMVVDVAQDRSLGARLLMWDATLGIYRDHPVLGVGLGNYKLFYPEYRDPRETTTSGDMAHNDYLQLLAEGGPALLVLVLAIGLLALRYLWLGYGELRRRRSPSKRPLIAYGCLFSLVALFGHALLNFIFYVLPLSILIGFFFAFAYREFEQGRGLPVRSGFNRRIAAGTAFAATVTIATLILDYVGAAVIGGQSQASWANSVREDEQKFMRVALFLESFRPNNSFPFISLAHYYHDNALTDPSSPTSILYAGQAADQITGIARSKKRDCITTTLAADLKSEFGDDFARLPSALADRSPGELYSLAIRQFPLCLPPYLGLAELHRREGYDALALETLLQAIRRFDTKVSHMRESRLTIIEHALQLADKVNEHKVATSLALLLTSHGRSNELAQRILRESPRRAQ